MKRIYLLGCLLAVSVSWERAEGWLETLAWSRHGLPEAHEGADGRRSEFRYDDAGRLIATRNPQGEEVRRRWAFDYQLIRPR